MALLYARRDCCPLYLYFENVGGKERLVDDRRGFWLINELDGMEKHIQEAGKK